MELTRWNPFGEIDSIFGHHGLPARLFDKKDYNWQPSADILESESEYLIKADLPNVKRADIKLSVDNGIITLTGERKQKKKDKDEKTLRTESFFGSFTRSFTLPNDVDVKKIKASKEDGVLTVHLPKSEARKDRSLDIKIN